MAKFYGVIGYAETLETSPGVWTEQITERNYYGDLINKYPNPGFIVGKAYEMVTDVDEYFVCPYLLPDAKFYIPGDGTYWYELSRSIN